MGRVGRRGRIGRFRGFKSQAAKLFRRHGWSKTTCEKRVRWIPRLRLQDGYHDQVARHRATHVTDRQWTTSQSLLGHRSGFSGIALYSRLAMASILVTSDSRLLWEHTLGEFSHLILFWIPMKFRSNLLKELDNEETIAITILTLYRKT